MAPGYHLLFARLAAFGPVPIPRTLLDKVCAAV